MRISPLVAAVALAALTLAPSDCSGTSGGTASPAASPSRSESRSPHAATRISTKASCPVAGKNLEGAFTKSSQMDDYLGCIVPEVEQWIDVVQPNKPHPQGYYFVPLGAAGTDGKCRYDDETLAYCPSSENIYFGERAVWTQYTKHGDASAALIMAHEVTHHFQRLVNVPPATAPHEQIRYENQADCGGGTFMQYAARQRWLNVKDDIIDLAGTLAAAGSAPGPDRDHGSIPERLAAFGRGAIGAPPNPLRSCNRYVPEVPLVP
jgi:predicted metalloprotease